MKKNILKQDFYARDTLTVARELLGKTLCRQYDGKIFKGMIVETEAYTQDDPACHAYKGKTERAKSLFAKPGTAYVYLIYGIHYCLNTSTEKEGFGSGVLIRALEPLENITYTNGPSKLCKSMHITKLHDGIELTDENSPLYIEDAPMIDNELIVQTTRIGIKKASEYLRRFYIKDNSFVSKK